MKIPVSHGHLEAALREAEGEVVGGAVLCHPDPLQGGTMSTKAIYRAGQALNQAGLRVLRFNFRGVGCSTGTFDEGIGEQEDVRAALDWLELGLRDAPLVAGGLSFGSMVSLGVGVEDSRVKAMVAMGGPVHQYDYAYLSETDKPVLVIQGERDEFGSAEEVRSIFRDYGPHVEVRTVQGSGHLFHGHMEELQTILREFFTSGAGSAVLGVPRPVSRVADVAAQKPC